MTCSNRGLTSRSEEDEAALHAKLQMRERMAKERALRRENTKRLQERERLNKIAQDQGKDHICT